MANNSPSRDDISTLMYHIEACRRAEQEGATLRARSHYRDASDYILAFIVEDKVTKEVKRLALQLHDLGAGIH